MPPKQLQQSTEVLFSPIDRPEKDRRPTGPLLGDEIELPFVDSPDLTTDHPGPLSISAFFGELNISTPRTSPNIFSDAPKKIVKPIKTPLLTEAQLLQRFSHLMESSTSINTDLLKKHIGINALEKSILDAFLHQTLFNPLAQRGILLLPTIEHQEYIEVNQILELIEGKPFPFITNVQCIDNQLLPIFEEKIVPTRFGYLALPVMKKDYHYGLLIIDINPVPGYSAGAIYVEPFHQIIMSDKDLLPTLTSLTCKLEIPNEKIQIIHLNQMETCGSDYVISVLTRISLDKLNLADPTSFLKLQNQTLNLDIIYHIRMAQIRLFGPSYFLYQLPMYLSDQEATILMAEIFLTETPDQQIEKLIEPPMTKFTDEDIFSDTPTEIETESESSDEEMNQQPRLKRTKALHDEDARPANMSWISMFTGRQIQHLNHRPLIKIETLDDQEAPCARTTP